MLDVTLEQLDYMKKFILKYDYLGDEPDVDDYLSQEWWQEDYEKEDMVKLYKTYPELMYMISPYFMYRLQKFYNNEFYCASWCGVFNLSSIYEFIKDFEKENKDF
jgi:hypothetical protein